VGNRRRAREQALQVLYLMDLSKISPNEALDFFKCNFDNHEDDYEFVKELVVGVSKHISEIDAKIEKSAQNWKISRMPRIDRNILRLGVYQILHSPDIPPAVAVDESIELSKRFGEDKTPAFVNGLLDRIFKDK